MKLSALRIQTKLHQLSSSKFSGESVLRFAGSNSDEMFFTPKEIRPDERPAQDLGTVIALYFHLRKFGAFGSISLIWIGGEIKNYSLRLTFQGLNQTFFTQNIFGMHQEAFHVKSIQS